MNLKPIKRLFANMLFWAVDLLVCFVLVPLLVLMLCIMWLDESACRWLNRLDDFRQSL